MSVLNKEHGGSTSANADAAFIAELKNAKESSIVSFDGLQLKFSSISLTSRWIHDSYDDTYIYNDAERGDKFLVVKVAISSEDKNPNLPPISVYRINQGNVELLGNMSYRFTKWDDYGSYLGNYADYKNDFAHTKTISFTAAITLPDKLTKDMPLLVVVSKKGCYARNESRFDTPLVSYTPGDCASVLPITLGTKDSTYAITKIFNKNKI